MVFDTVKERYSYFDELRGCGYATSLFVSIMIVLTYDQDTDDVSPFERYKDALTVHWGI